ncbi:MAG: hypothetical protein Q8P56_01430 [Candidatus Uhrbacteria bacterium]|nr:hypothetical protein [Candidatus Uhrbacteria bacterium]
MSCVFAVVALVAQAADLGLSFGHPVARSVPLIPQAVLDAVVGCQGTVMLRGEVSGGGCLVDKEKKLVLTSMHVVVPMGWRKGSRIVLPKPLSMSFDVLNPQTLQTTSLLVERVYHFEGDLALVRVSRVPSWMSAAKIAQSEVFDTLVGRELYAVLYRFDTLYEKNYFSAYRLAEWYWIFRLAPTLSAVKRICTTHTWPHRLSPDRPDSPTLTPPEALWA